MAAFPSLTTVSPGKSPGSVDAVWLLSVELEGLVSSFGTAVVVLSASALVVPRDSSGSFLLSIVLKFFKTQLCPVVRIWRKDALFLGNANDKQRHLKDTWSVVLANIYQRKALWPVNTKLILVNKCLQTPTCYVNLIKNHIWMQGFPTSHTFWRINIHNFTIFSYIYIYI